jgi:hypothetical protein
MKISKIIMLIPVNFLTRKFQFEIKFILMWWNYLIVSIENVIFSEIPNTLFCYENCLLENKLSKNTKK